MRPAVSTSYLVLVVRERTLDMSLMQEILAVLTVALRLINGRHPYGVDTTGGLVPCFEAVRQRRWLRVLTSRGSEQIRDATHLLF